MLQDNAALRKENADLRQENAAFRKELADLRTAWGNVRGDFRRQLLDCCACSEHTTEAVANPYWKVTSGDCVADLDCLTSPGYPQNYPDDVTCSVEILSNWSGYLDVQDFELELSWDFLWVNEQSYTGSVLGVAGVFRDGSWRRTTPSLFTADHTTNALGFKLCRSLEQVTLAVTQVPTMQVNPANSSFNEFWGVTEGGCYLDTAGCINSPNYPVGYLASSPCAINITESWNGGGLRVVEFSTERDWDSLYVNGKGYSGDLDDVDGLQGMVPTTSIFWSPDDNTEKKGWKQCRDAQMEGEWINWTCTVTGAACHSFPNIYPKGACTTLFSDEDDQDGDGLLHTGHPYCVAEAATGDLGRMPCGPCSCLPGEDQSTALRILGNGWNEYEYIECEACLPGRYRSEGGYGVEPRCSLCDKGSHASSSGAFACDPCLPGRAATSEGAVECVLCDPGTYSVQDGASACLSCVPGYYHADGGASACEACGLGNYSLESASTCKGCNAGYYGNLRGLSSCQACPVGFFASVSGLTVCHVCPSGTRVGPIASTLCIQCEAGFFSEGGNSTSCTECAVGTFSNVSGHVRVSSMFRRSEPQRRESRAVGHDGVHSFEK